MEKLITYLKDNSERIDLLTTETGYKDLEELIISILNDAVETLEEEITRGEHIITNSLK